MLVLNLRDPNLEERALMDDEAAGTLVGICIAYCENGEVKQQWININAVQAIAWGNGKVNERPGNPSHSSAKIPPGNAPTKCPPTGVGGAPVCWWTGSAWVCGEA